MKNLKKVILHLFMRLKNNKLVLLYKKVDDNDGYKAEITTTFKKI